MIQNRGFEKLQQQFNENPLGTIAVASLAATALSKLLNVLNDRHRIRINDREIARRERMEYRRPSRSRR